MRERTKTKRAPGRPRQFETDVVLDRAMQVFWARGFAATSVDDLAGAMGMNRPSIANAFGDKEALYRQTLERFASTVKAQMATVLATADLRSALTQFYYAALDVYFADEPAPGCFVMCTAPVEALDHPRVRTVLATMITDIDEALAGRFAQAEAAGDLAWDVDANSAAQMAQAVLHSLAIRARAGASKASLRRLARTSARLLASGG